MSPISISAQIELRDVTSEMENLANLPKLNDQQKTRFSYLQSKAALLRSGALSDEVRREEARRVAIECGLPVPELLTSEEHARRDARDSFRAYLAQGEFRTYVNMNTVTGSNGGYLLPVEFQRILLQGMAQYDDLLNPDNVRVINTQNGHNLSLPSVDLSVISSAIVSQQNTQQAPVANPTVASNSFGGYSYKTNPIAVTMEGEQDFFESAMTILSEAFGVGLARGIGSDLVNGNGSSAPLGLLTAAANSGITTAAAGAISAADIEAIFFSINRAYRQSPKCAWVMADVTYQLVRAAKDSNGRPLLNLFDDKEVLMGKRVLIAPSMPSTAGSKGIVFGDLGQFAVRVVGSPEVKRNSEAPGYVEKATSLFTGWLRIDSGLIAPGGVNPIVYATLHS